MGDNQAGMKWFRHHSDLRYDPRVKRLIRKFGIEGYGIYLVILESIAQTLNETDPLPDLKETAEDLADEYEVDIRKIEEITKFCLTQDLLQYSSKMNCVIAMRIAELMDDYTGRKKPVLQMIDNMKREIENSGVTPKLIQTYFESSPEIVTLDKKRTEEKRSEKNTSDKKPTAAKPRSRTVVFQKPTTDEIKEYADSIGFTKLNAEYFFDFYEAKDWRAGQTRIKDWKAKVRNWKQKDKEFQSNKEDPESRASRQVKEIGYPEDES